VSPVRGMLDRIASGSRQVDVVDSVMAHLQLLLNTHIGDSPAAPDFGIVDFTEVVHQLPQSVATLQTAIRNCLQRYEPRLQNVTVRFVPSDDVLGLQFEISGRIIDEKRRAVRLQTRLCAGGHFEML
jgi:type VI secretion system protein